MSKCFETLPLFIMDNLPRKIAIHFRTPKSSVNTHHHKKARAHLHVHTHDKLQKQIENTPEEPSVTSRWSKILINKPKKAEEPTKVKLVEKPILEKKEKVHIQTETVEQSHSVTPKEMPETLSERTSVVVAPRRAEAMVPSKLIIPKKPMVIEGISMSALSIAYFCMEVGIDPAMPTYSGGLGILAGDTLRSAADLKINTIGVTLLYRKGYFRQHFDESGWQVEEDETWDPNTKLILLPNQTEITLEGRSVRVRAWLHKINGVSGHVNPLIFLDTDIDGNTPDDRQITAKLYSGDSRMRLMQEAVLGIGGVRMLQLLGATNVQKFHMNEGHSALLTLELYRQYVACDEPVEEVRRRAVFTTHTPVAAGHDVFDRNLATSVLGDGYIAEQITNLAFVGDTLNMTHLGFNFSNYRNGVAKKHGEVTRELFPGYQIESITNGVHAREWVSEPIAALYDRYIPGWRIDAYNLRYALLIPADELWHAHQTMKLRLCEYIHSVNPNLTFDPQIFTIGFARRATAYKRGNILFHDIERLKRIAEKSNGIQIVYAGKAHPEDRDGKLMMQDIIRQMGSLFASKVKCVYLPNYSMELAKLLVGGVDLWLNTPARPMEASGTSGMKAAMNGNPHFSTLDGWWLEGHIEGVTGWSIGPHPENAGTENVDAVDLEDLYTKLEYVILPKFEGDKHSWIKMMRSAIAINGSFFNTQRMLEQYVLGAYYK